MARPRKDPNAIPTNIRILDAAEFAFGNAGYLGTSLDDIANAVGIRSPSLLYHFESKAVLYGAVIDRLFEDLWKRLWEILSKPGKYEDRVLDLMSAFLKFIEDHPAFAPIVLREVIDGQGPVRMIIVNQIVPILDQITEWIEVNGEGLRPEGVPVRGALVTMCSDALIRAASGPLQVPLWGPESQTMVLYRELLLAGTSST
jgi:AcrR family transcriptional regulator